MHNLNSHFFHSNKGAVAVEFSIIFTLFFLCCYLAQKSLAYFIFLPV